MLIVKNDRGISLIQVMMALALLGVVQVAFMRMSKNQNKSVKTTEVKFESIDAVNSIKQILADKEACHNTFGIVPGTPENTGIYDPNLINVGTVTEIKSATDVVLYESNTNTELAPQIGSSKLKIISFRVNSAGLAPIGADSKGVTEVFVNLDRGEVYGSETIEKKFRLNVRTDSAGLMVDCSTAQTGDGLEATAAYVCQTIGGTFDPNGRGGNGDCHSLSPNQTTTFNGDVVLTDTFSFDFLSDRRLKSDIVELENSLTKIRKLRPVSYNWKRNGQKEIGFIAQEVESVYPDFVSKTPSGKLAVKYPQMVSAALMGIKELDKINYENQRTINYLLEEQELLKRQIFQMKIGMCLSSPDLAICRDLKE